MMSAPASASPTAMANPMPRLQPVDEGRLAAEGEIIEDHGW